MSTSLPDKFGQPQTLSKEIVQGEDEESTQSLSPILPVRSVCRSFSPPTTYTPLGSGVRTRGTFVPPGVTVDTNPIIDPQVRNRYPSSRRRKVNVVLNGP